MKLLSVILIFLFCYLEAVYEGVEFRGKKDLAKMLQAVWIGIAFALMWIAFRMGQQGYELNIFYYWIGIYLLIRLDFFNIIWNICAGQHWAYIGKGWYDRNIGKYFMTAPVILFTIFLTVVSIFEYKKK